MGKSCEDTLALQGGLYQWALTQQNQRFEDRERLNSELFGVYIDGRSGCLPYGFTQPASGTPAQ